MTAAEYEFLHKPLAAISCNHTGIPPQELLFWTKCTVDQLYTIFQCLTASPSKVLQLIEEPVMLHGGEKKVFQFLQQFIENMSNEDIGHFLRFVTGSSVCPTKKYKLLSIVSLVFPAALLHTHVHLLWNSLPIMPTTCSFPLK